MSLRNPYAEETRESDLKVICRPRDPGWQAARTRKSSVPTKNTSDRLQEHIEAVAFGNSRHVRTAGVA